MLPQSQFDSPVLASADARVAIAALTQDRALIGLLRSTVDPTTDVLLVTSEAELAPHLNGRRVSACLLDSMFIEGDLAEMAERLRATWPDLVLVVVGTAEEQSRVAGQITSGVVYRFLHRPVSAPRVRLFVEAALRRHEVENVERTLEQVRPDFSRLEAPKAERPAAHSGGGKRGAPVFPILAVIVVLAGAAGWYLFVGGGGKSEPAAEVVSSGEPPAAAVQAPPEARVAPPAATASVAEVLKDAPPASQPAAAVTPAAGNASSAASGAAAPAVAPTPTVAQKPREAPPVPSVVTLPEEIAPESTAPKPTREQRLREQLTAAEGALQRGELASPAGSNAVELFRGALALDPGNTLAKAGLVRVSDRLLSAAERALTAGNAEDARSMVAVAETLTPATARGAFLMMQIEREHERAALTRAKDSTDNSQSERGATYLRLANSRLHSGALIEPSEDNARFYLEAAREAVPDDPALPDISRSLQKALLDHANDAAAAGNAAETERWLANADSAGAGRAEMATIRRALQDTLINTRASKVATLAQSFSSALNFNRLVMPADASAKAYLLQLINTDAGNPAVASARQGLGLAYVRELRGALGRNDVVAADQWLGEARIIGFTSDDLTAAEGEIAAARERHTTAASVVGASSLQRLEYVAPKFPVNSLNRGVTGWVELEFTVEEDGSTGDIAVTNSSPRKTFDSAAITAVRQWRYQPVRRDGKPVEQRASVRIRFADE